MERIRELLKYPALAGLVMLLLASCENSSRPVINGQNATTINDTAITSQVNNSLVIRGVESNGNTFSLRIFNPLADRDPAERNRPSNLTRDLRVIHAIERTRQQILTQAYIIKISALVSRPGQIDSTENFAASQVLNTIFATGMKDRRTGMETWNNQQSNESIRQANAI